MSVPVRRAIYGALAGFNQLTALLGQPVELSQALYHQVAPSGAQFPYVIFFKAAGTPRYALGTLAFNNEIWTIKGVAENLGGESAADRADHIAFYIDERLTDRPINIAGTISPTGIVGRPYLRREADVEYSEVVDGVLYAHSGANYRLIYQPD